MAEEKFLVHPEALTGYAGLLERNNGYVGKMLTYVEGPGSQIDGLKFLMSGLRHRLERLNTWQHETLTDIHTKLGDTAAGLKAAATEYTNMDQGAAERMDRTVPTAPE